MPSINISEADFNWVAGAAMDAHKEGDDEAAEALDKIARKINCALSTAATKGYSWASGGGGKRLTWRDMPSTLDGASQ